jgi:pimeloyl-ACP methyl ester carboxylesterase
VTPRLAVPVADGGMGGVLATETGLASPAVSQRIRRTRAGDGTVLAWQEAGTGPALLLVHATASDARQWARLVPLLAEHFRVVTMDRRGRRASGAVGPAHSLATEYGDIAAVAGAVGAPVHILGHSSGARFALHAAPDIAHLASLILYEPPEPRDLPDHLLASLDRLEAAGDRAGLLRFFLVDYLGNGEDDLAFLQDRPIWPIMMDNALTLPAELRAGRRYRFSPADVAGIRVPTLLLIGEESREELGQITATIAAAVPGATVATLAGQGHGAMFSAPDLLAAEVLGFIRR